MSMGITGAELETYSQKAFLSDPDQDNWLTHMGEWDLPFNVMASKMKTEMTFEKLLFLNYITLVS